MVCRQTNWLIISRSAQISILYSLLMFYCTHFVYHDCKLIHESNIINYQSQNSANYLKCLLYMERELSLEKSYYVIMFAWLDITSVAWGWAKRHAGVMSCRRHVMISGSALCPENLLKGKGFERVTLALVELALKLDPVHKTNGIWLER